jgi:hypothetical protein
LNTAPVKRLLPRLDALFLAKVRELEQTADATMTARQALIPA